MEYEELVADVRVLIDDTGRSVAFQRLSPTPADNAKPWRGPAAPTVDTAVTQAATFVPASGADLGKMLVSDEMLSRVEQVCLTAPNVVMDLNTCTAVLDDGVRWAVGWVAELRPGGVSLLFALGLKR